MGDYRLLANSMWVGEKLDQRAHRGDVVQLDDDAKRTKLLVDQGLVVKKGEESDELKKEWEARDKAAEAEKTAQEEIKQQEEEIAKQGGKAENATAPKAPAPSASVGKSSSQSTK